MKKIFIILFPLLLCTHKLNAQNWDKFFDVVFPFPILSLSTGAPEFLAADLGIESLFIKVGDTSTETRCGIYLLFSPSRAWDNDFYRFSTGFALGTMGLIEVRAGIGYGFMREETEYLHTSFYEVAARLFLLQCKFIVETPLKPSELVKYYENQYKPIKFQIGISI